MEPEANTPPPPPSLTSDFRATFPELVVPASVEEQPAPRLVQLNEALAAELGLNIEWLRTEAGLRFLLGAHSDKVAMAYAGHQFGQLQPLLGDGRAVLLGELQNSEGYAYELHLKGSGPTQFSRGGDGRGALGPMLREYLISESLHALGVPSTRALAVITTGRKIQRGRVVPGAMVLRVARSHLRVGTFQYAALRHGPQLVERLVDYALARLYPTCPREEFFAAVFDAQRQTVAHWMRIGFIHGVMNTDNTTISGETIDFGPCAFTPTLDPEAVYSSIDTGGRYRFGQQQKVLSWNMARFAETLAPLFGVEKLTSALQQRLQQPLEIESLSTKTPLYLPHNHLVEQALSDAEAGDFTRFEQLFTACTHPYTRHKAHEWLIAPAPVEYEGYRTFCGT